MSRGCGWRRSRAIFSAQTQPEHSVYTEDVEASREEQRADGQRTCVEMCLERSSVTESFHRWPECCKVRVTAGM